MKNYVSRQIKLVKFEDNALERCEVSLVDEHILKLFINDRLNKEFICLNQNLEDVVAWMMPPLNAALSNQSNTPSA